MKHTFLRRILSLCLALCLLTGASPAQGAALPRNITLTFSDGSDPYSYTLLAGLDAQNVPGALLSHENRTLALSRSGLWAATPEGSTGVSIETLLQAALMSLLGTDSLPQYSASDAQLLMTIGEEIGQKLLPLVSINADETSPSQSVTTVTLPVNGLMTALDQAVCDVLTQHAAGLDDLIGRSQPLAESLLGVRIPSCAELLRLWQSLRVSSLLTENTTAEISLTCKASDNAAYEQFPSSVTLRLTVGGEAYVLATDDFVWLLSELSGLYRYVADESFHIDFGQRNGAQHVRLKLDLPALCTNLTDGLAAILHANSGRVNTLIQRYSGWLKLLGVQAPQFTTGELVGDLLLHGQSRLMRELPSHWCTFVVTFDLEYNAKHILPLSLEARLNDTELRLNISSTSFDASLTVANRYSRYLDCTASGFLHDGYGEAIIVIKPEFRSGRAFRLTCEPRDGAYYLKLTDSSETYMEATVRDGLITFEGSGLSGSLNHDEDAIQFSLLQGRSSYQASLRATGTGLLLDVTLPTATFTAEAEVTVAGVSLHSSFTNNKARSVYPSEVSFELRPDSGVMQFNMKYINGSVMRISLSHDTLMFHNDRTSTSLLISRTDNGNTSSKRYAITYQDIVRVRQQKEDGTYGTYSKLRVYNGTLSISNSVHNSIFLMLTSDAHPKYSLLLSWSRIPFQPKVPEDCKWLSPAELLKLLR